MVSSISTVLINGCILSDNTIPTEHSYIKDAIQSGLYQDFWSEDSLLVDGFQECYGEQLTCEGLNIYPDGTDDNVMYVDIGEDSCRRFTITIEEV